MMNPIHKLDYTYPVFADSSAQRCLGTHLQVHIAAKKKFIVRYQPLVASSHLQEEEQTSFSYLIDFILPVGAA
jgi:hypothetical protein